MDQTFRIEADLTTAALNAAIAWLGDRGIDARPAYVNAHHKRHVLAVLLVRQADVVMDLNGAMHRRAARMQQALARAADRDAAASLNQCAQGGVRAGLAGALRLSTLTAEWREADRALTMLIRAWEACDRVAQTLDTCTHGADCPLHRDATGLHNEDVPWC